MKWAEPAVRRDQGVLFQTSLDDAIPANHPVRFFDEIHRSLDWSKFEARYDDRRGQPAIHPRVLASVILYGATLGIRSSRALENAVLVRLDFQWLADGHTMDHSTLSEFRRTFAEERKDLFVQVNQLAQKTAGMTLRKLAFDGTRIRANNRRSGSRSIETLEQVLQKEANEEVSQAELERQFDEMEADIEREDSLPEASLPPELADANKRLAALGKAAAELKRMKQAGEKLPKRLPITDPDSRITPNKEGGFAPNYTPLATVDVDTGLIVDCDVIPHTDEERHLLGSVDRVQQTYHCEVEAVMADAAMCNGTVLQGMEEREIHFYSPIPDPEDNPAKRSDPSVPVPPELWDQLPTQTVKNRDGQKQQQLAKSTFLYDEANDCYWCPNGQKLEVYRVTTETNPYGEKIRHTRYRADPQQCADCPLKHLCLQANSAAKKPRAREVERDQFEGSRQRHKERMATDQAKQAYRRRPGAVERPFAVIKQQLNVRQFLVRGIQKVRNEWGWITLAFNLRELSGRLRRTPKPT